MAENDLYSKLLEQEAERLMSALERIKEATWRTGQTLPRLRREIALILKELKDE